MDNYDELNNALIDTIKPSITLNELSKELEKIEEKNRRDASLASARDILIKHLESKKAKRQTLPLDIHERRKYKKDLDDSIEEQKMKISSPRSDREFIRANREFIRASKRSKDKRSKDIQKHRIASPIFNLSFSKSKKRRRTRTLKGILKKTKGRSKRKSKRVSFGNCPCIL